MNREPLLASLAAGVTVANLNEVVTLLVGLLSLAWWVRIWINRNRRKH